ncbi:MAG: class I SAM-dependent methyltransferase [Solirubrobacterales bacterium]|jgi:SAM-dependent methyltransferase|nr:class I SAM-dependent methyltransferase [Solirubrobacterales bacterium]
MIAASAARDGLEYWARRAEELGARAVVNVDHPAGRDLAAVTAGHRDMLFPSLAGLLDGSERVVCDLGCGAGRFTADLAALIGGRAIGVEPVAALRSLAPEARGVSYRALRPNGRLPLRDGEADVVVTVTVLGGLVAAGELAQTAAEVRRVLRPGGLVCLAESVSDAPRTGHWAPRTVEAYRSAFAWAGLEEVARFDDAGDPISVLAGRVGI